MKREIIVDLPYMFILDCQIPSGKNAVQITRTGKRYPGKRFKAWRDEAMGKIPYPVTEFSGPVTMTVDYVPGDNIRRDVPGLLDALCHLIEKVGLVRDDAQVKCVQWTTFPVQPNRPRCSVSLAEL
jgi:Holliday junction resolvase RusA-like endonuclease